MLNASHPDGEAALRLENVTRGYGSDAMRADVLRNVNLTVKRGEIVALVGPSGSGKSTLLQIAGLLDTPEAGRVYIGGKDCQDLDDAALSAYRGVKIGFVYQFHRLLPEFSATENVMIPQLLAGASKSAAKERAVSLLKKLGLGHRLQNRPGELSGGEQQRAAIARAMANNPILLLADEPTGNLDTATANVVFKELTDFIRDSGAAALVATHNPELALRMGRVVDPSGAAVTLCPSLKKAAVF